MALNPPISPQGLPLRVEGELFVLERKDMEIEIKINNMGKYCANGKMYLTTARIIFVSDKFEKDIFKSFDIPIVFMSGEKFQQPIFGSNYLEGNVKPLHNLLPGDTHFKLWFKAGGCTMFLKILVELLKQVRTRRGQGQMGPDPRWVDQISSTQAQAYTDSSDPSVVYVQQPQNTFSNNQQFIGTNIYSQVPQPQNQNQPNRPQQPQQQNQNQGQQNQNQQNRPQQPPQQIQNQGQQNQNQDQGSQNQGYQYPSGSQINQSPQQPNQNQQGPFQGQGVVIGNNEQPVNPPNNYNYPAEDNSPQPLQQQQPQQQQEQANRPNIGYYYGNWGPQLNNNNNNQL